jgi:hypothetical protein
MMNDILGSVDSIFVATAFKGAKKDTIVQELYSIPI